MPSLHALDMRWAARRSGAPAATATRRATDTLVIVLIVLLLIWEVLHRVAGETALPAPWPTLTYLARTVTTPRFAAGAATTALD